MFLKVLILNYLVNDTYTVCYMGNNCCQYFVIEYDGSVYPCDFYVRDDLLLGNIKTNSWAELLKSPIYNHFGNQKIDLNDECRSCRFITLCHGDCQKFRRKDFMQSKSQSILCKGWKRFYVNSLPRFRMLANDIINNSRSDSKFQVKTKKIGRNSPCPCGSGKKYKNCCFR